ncbi:MAG: hypothetical protein J4N29_04255 [Chloroflexi bacterium]|nr:hypothetical protein [Chloroflexota bacterium]
MAQHDPDELSAEAFAALAAQLGVPLSPERLAELYPDVKVLLERIAPLWDIDVSSVAPEEVA